VRGAYESGTPAIGVGVGNVAVIVDETADVADAAAKIARSKTFDNATSCSSKNSVIAVESIADALLRAFEREGGALRDANETAALRRTMFQDGKLSSAVVAQDVATIARLAGLTRPAVQRARFLIVPEKAVSVASIRFRARSCLRCLRSTALPISLRSWRGPKRSCASRAPAIR